MKIDETFENRNSFDIAFYQLAEDWAKYMVRCDQLDVSGTDDSKDDEINYGLLENIVFYVLGTWFHDEGQMHLDLEHCYKTEWKTKLDKALDTFDLEMERRLDEKGIRDE
tara:strand:- start:312 stop:641 length:330 start_codon:yes stop_codon:yes gene_type:complete